MPRTARTWLLVGFDDGSYIELIAPERAGQGNGSGWGKLMADNAGPCAWAVEPKDIGDEAARLKSIGIAVEGPTLGSRKKPDGMAVEWDLANVGTGAPGATLPLLIQDRTPNAAVALFRKAYGWAAPMIEDHGDFDAKLAYFPGEPVILAAPAGGHSWLADRLQKNGESPAAYLLATRDLNGGAKKFHLSGTKNWFGQRVAWFDAKKLSGVRLGVIGQ